MLNAFEYKDFRLLWVSTMSAAFAMQLQIVARGWLTYDMTQSALALAGVMIAFMAPSVFVSPIGGIIADRWDKKPLMVISQALNAIATGLFAWVIYTGNVNYWHFIYFGVFNGTVLALSMPARSTIMPDIVGTKNLTNAMMLSSATFNASRVLGPPLAGLLIGWFAAGNTTSTTGVGLVFFCITALYAGSVVLTMLLDFRGEPQRDEVASPIEDLIEAVHYVKNEPVVMGLILIGLVPMTFGFAPTFLLPVFNAELLNNKPEEYGFLLGGMGCGALSGSLIFAQAGDLRRKGRTLFIAAFVWSFTLFLFAFCDALLTATAVLFFVGLAGSVMGSLNMSMLQLVVPGHIRGRVMALSWTAHGFMPLGIIPIAWLAETYSIQIALFSSAVLVGATTLLFRLMYPAVGQVKSGHPVEHMSAETSDNPLLIDQPTNGTAAVANKPEFVSSKIA